MISLMKTIAERLKAARDRKEWSQGQLASAAGLSQSTIGNIEAGVRQGKGSLPQIAEALGVRHKWLADGKGEMLDTGTTQASNLTPEAQSLAELFDLLVDRIDRAKAYNVASQAILKQLDERNSRPSASHAQPGAAKTR